MTHDRTRTVEWSTRHLPLDLRDRLQLLAIERGVPAWQVANEALLIGLTTLEQRQATMATRATQPQGAP